MICPTCRTAADAQLPAGQHCDDPGCMCGHRVERYRLATGFDVVAAHHAGLAAIVDQATEVRPRVAPEQPRIAEPDDPPCAAAAIANRTSVVRCHLIAGHYDETRHPVEGFVAPNVPGFVDIGGWHTDGIRAWTDHADGATPHLKTTED